MLQNKYKSVSVSKKTDFIVKKVLDLTIFPLTPSVLAQINSCKVDELHEQYKLSPLTKLLYAYTMHSYQNDQLPSNLLNLVTKNPEFSFQVSELFHKLSEILPMEGYDSEKAVELTILPSQIDEDDIDSVPSFRSLCVFALAVEKHNNDQIPLSMTEYFEAPENSKYVHYILQFISREDVKKILDA